ncbi:hypothetical protein [Sphingobacterium sp. DR205]|uniref:hypothetical protein n=1 Tax=Sphingobacterium sp. DR205 TaxID=2713573 RepID=UPI0013E43C76|nr:hypothetical protein [Sphingobacterium sp. DR205]QIH33438.1 hypothetical protein G6053_11320 [Sphingobacterium sp. DR205]
MFENFSKKEFEMAISNPFYCLETVAEIFTDHHEPLISEQQWISANANLIHEIGPDRWLALLLENLKGNYLTS